MKTTIASYIRKTALQSNADYWASKIRDNFELNTEFGSGVHDDYLILREKFNILQPVPVPLIKDCGIKNLFIRGDMGPNKPYYPNHGYFIGDQVALLLQYFKNVISPFQPSVFGIHRVQPNGTIRMK